MELKVLHEALVKKYSADIFRFAYRLCGDRNIAEDLVQETFYEAWRSIGNLREPSSGKFWLLQILRHRYSHWLRKEQRHPLKVINPDELKGLSSEIHLDLELLKQDEPLQKALNALDVDYRGIFLLVFLEGWSCREVAQEFDLPLGTVLSRIHRARMFLREFIKRYNRALHDDVRNFKRWFEESNS